ncbi:cysteine hydrolase [Anaerovorax odorimutans]|uniref:Cysteine hydrolase n=1 Tax=Anaerovorax odorimutans TaxID=109327 RepID=A0ABT1RSC0_9FIRM|nr:isochorismatase family cysteine hydrolase [Anaerovorax odorimutans]MCQ4638103.1 cysteine hydrolase [Anaerovorax odorimutans]
MSKLLIIVDMQNDFIDGALGTQEAQEIVARVNEKIQEYDQRGDLVIFTADTHSKEYLETQEGRNLPVPHCMKGSQGWEISSALFRPQDAPVIEKDTFGSKELGIMLMEMERAGEVPAEIELVGLCTDICVISNAMIVKAFLPEVPVTVDASCCAGVTPESHENALKAMEVCQIHVIGKE